MQINIETKTLSQLTTKEKKYLSKMTLDTGMMNPILSECHFSSSFKEDFILAIAKNGFHYLGWSLIKKIDRHNIVMCYVKPKYRRRGIGKMLILSLKKRVRRNLFAWPWNLAGRKLFISADILI